MYLVYNSDILPESNLLLTADNRAFRYGDGLFETIRFEQGQLWFWADHYTRLSRGMQALQLQARPDMTPDVLEGHITALLYLNGLAGQAARIKLQVWRQPGGLYTPAGNESEYLLTVLPGQPFTITARNRLGVYDAVRLTSSPVSAFKTLNALPYVLAGLYKQQQQLDDVILLDTAGHLAECNASNLFWFRARTLFTPSLASGCIDGIVRRQLLRQAAQAGFSVNETLSRPDALTEAGLIFCCNAAGIQWFRQLDIDGVSTNMANAAQALDTLRPLFATLMP
ncbi:aminodeoxychorismate lyase [Nibrella saemangeumensis]|uniref:branched-chain-amino-acid transaminase n=1 Tax=Nibrella saemangeumensis TaxID=1084526 RepID=A0ABP8M9G2_9BACT